MFSIIRKLFANFLDDFNIICYWNKIFMKQTFYIYYILHFSKIFQKYIYIYIYIYISKSQKGIKK